MRIFIRAIQYFIGIALVLGVPLGLIVVGAALLGKYIVPVLGVIVGFLLCLGWAANDIEIEEQEANAKS